MHCSQTIQDNRMSCLLLYGCILLLIATESWKVEAFVSSSSTTKRFRQQQPCLSAPSSSSSSTSHSNNTQNNKPRSIKSSSKKKEKNSAINKPSEDKRRASLDVGNNPLLSLNLNLDALVKGNAPHRAEELYKRIFSLYADGYYATAPDIVSFNTVLKGLSFDASKALDFWHEQFESPQDSESNNHRPIEPNTRSYNTILLSLAKAGLYEPALEILSKMKEFDSSVVPDRITYNTVLLAFATNTEESSIRAALLAEELLLEMIEESNRATTTTTSTESAATTTTTNQTKSPSSSLVESFVALTEEWTPPPPKPDVISFNTVIAAWAKRGQADRAEEWLRHMETKGHLSPDVYSYSSVIQAWAEQGQAERALELLQEMLQKSLENPRLRPNAYTYTGVVRALCQSRQMDQAQDLVRQMWKEANRPVLDDNYRSPRPNVVTFSILLNGWSQLAHEEPEKAVAAVLALYKEMQELSARYPDTAPNERTYSSILKTLAQARLKEGPTMARSVIADLLQESQNVAKVSLIHFNAWLDVVAKAPVAEKAVEAWMIYTREMLPRGWEGDSITFNSILSAAANAFGHEPIRVKSLQVGRAAFAILTAPERNDKDQERQLHPDSQTYLNMMKALRKFLPKDATKASGEGEWKAVITSCLDEGCLNEYVLKYIMDYAPKASLPIELSENGRVSVKQLSPDWSQNALPELRPPR